MSLIKDCIGTPLFAMPQGVIEPEKEKHLLPGKMKPTWDLLKGSNWGWGRKLYHITQLPGDSDAH